MKKSNQDKKAANQKEPSRYPLSMGKQVVGDFWCGKCGRTSSRPYSCGQKDCPYG